MLPNSARPGDAVDSVGRVRLRLGLVGAGARGSQHASTIAGLADLYDFVAVCDSDQGRAQKLAQRFGVHAYRDVGAFFSREHLDAVVIATPGETHHVIAKAAADHRVHMLIEVPLATTRGMMDFIEEVADKAEVQVEVGENYGRRPADLLNRQALQAGLIGRLVHLSFFNSPANHHTMSLFRFYAGADVEEVHAIPRRAPLDAEVSGVRAETWTEAVVTFTNGLTATASYVSSWMTPLRWGRPRIATVDGTAGYIVSTSEGANHLRCLDGDGSHDYLLNVVPRGVVIDREKREIPARFLYGTNPVLEVANPFADRVLADAEPTTICEGLARAAELASLHRAVTTGTPPAVGTAFARRSQEIAIAIHESARLDRPMSARLGEETVWEREQHEAFERTWGSHPLRGVEAVLNRTR